MSTGLKNREILSRFDIEVISGTVPVLHDLIRLRLSTGLVGGGCGQWMYHYGGEKDGACNVNE